MVGTTLLLIFFFMWAPTRAQDISRLLFFNSCQSRLEVTFFCETTGNSIGWIVEPFIAEDSNPASFIPIDGVGAAFIEHPEAIRILVSTSPLQSTLLLRPGNLMNTTIFCFTDGGISDSVQYIKAEPPLPPSNIDATDTQGSDCLLSADIEWAPPSSSAISHYNIYVNASSTPMESVDNRTRITVKDCGNSSVVYFELTISTVDECGLESVPSAPYTFAINRNLTDTGSAVSNGLFNRNVEIVIVVLITILFSAALVVLIWFSCWFIITHHNPCDFDPPCSVKVRSKVKNISAGQSLSPPPSDSSSKAINNDTPKEETDNVVEKIEVISLETKSGKAEIKAKINRKVLKQKVEEFKLKKGGYNQFSNAAESDGDGHEPTYANEFRMRNLPEFDGDGGHDETDGDQIRKRQQKQPAGKEFCIIVLDYRD